MTEINIPTRAKGGYIEVERQDKGGRTVKARDHNIASVGMFSTKELVKELEQVCDDYGYSYDQIRIQPYENGQSPIEANPRHRGLGPVRYHKYPDSAPREVEQHRESRPRKYFFGGWSRGS